MKVKKITRRKKTIYLDFSHTGQTYCYPWTAAFAQILGNGSRAVKKSVDELESVSRFGLTLKERTEEAHQSFGGEAFGL